MTDPAAPATGPRIAGFRRQLSDLRPVDDAQDRLRREYLEFVASRGDSALDRDGGPEHVTASTFVFDAELRRILLTLHRKGRFWVQFGGHIEPGDVSVTAAAFREAAEESGVDDLVPLSSEPLDLDRHTLGAGFSCTRHWDVGFAAVAPAGAVPAVSDESEDVRWWPVDELPEPLAGGFARRLGGILRALRP